jgi:hypothetical protein
VLNSHREQRRFDWMTVPLRQRYFPSAVQPTMRPFFFEQGVFLASASMAVMARVNPSDMAPIIDLCNFMDASADIRQTISLITEVAMALRQD